MDPVTYEQLVTYLSTLVLSPFVPIERHKHFRQSASYYLVRGTLLYRKNKQNPDHPLRVVTRKDMETVLRAFHEDPLAGHFGIDQTYQKIAERYTVNPVNPKSSVERIFFGLAESPDWRGNSIT